MQERALQEEKEEARQALTQSAELGGTQPTLPAASANRRLTVFGSVEALGRGRIEVRQARQDSAGFARHLAALDARHEATGRQIILVLDNDPCHVSKRSHAALAARGDW